jgi:hypothetical protein
LNGSREENVDLKLALAPAALIAVLVVASVEANALSRETRAQISAAHACEAAKLEATSVYHRCLTRALNHATVEDREVTDHDSAHCDRRFDRAFERAEASGACRTPGGASTVREPLKAQVQMLVDNLMAETGCANLTIVPGDIATCTVNKTTSAIDLAPVVDFLSTFGVTDDTTFWI